jgi:cytochrome c biogenesis protein CcmG, thiol:disulfide interchange protein DsbE
METTERQTFAVPRRGISPGSLFLFVGLFAVIAVVGLQLIRRNAGPVTRGPAPDFAIQSYGDGSEFRLSEQRGKFVVVNFWGSWCPGCRDEAPELEEAWQKYRDDGVVVVGIGYNDVESAARRFLDEFAITFPTGNDTGLRITAAYGVTGAPETYIVGPDGEVAAFVIGQFEQGWLDRTLQRLLAEAQAS